MADRTIKPDDGNDLVLQNNHGDGKIEINEDDTVKITGNVGIGTSPSAKLHIEGSGVDSLRFGNIGDSSNSALRISRDDTSIQTNNPLGYLEFGGKDNTGTVDTAHAYIAGVAEGNHTAGSNPTRLIFGTTPSGSETIAEVMRIDSDGHLLVDTTDKGVYASTSSGAGIRSEGIVFGSRGAVSGIFNRHTTDGEAIQIRKDGTSVGAIGTYGGDLIVGTGDTKLRFDDNGDTINPRNEDGTGRDNAVDLGYITVRFDDVYATNGTIQTSDRNEKQDIEELSEAEQRVAVVAKGLLRKFRWKSAVEKKGDDARIHFGIIAQDLKSAFEAEGLDAGRYAMFIHSEWWETQTEVPAVEAQDAVYETQIDEEGNEVQVLVSEAVEAKEAYTRTETYDTEEEAPEGAIKKDRMGVRYSELLAFIISAI